MSSSFNKVILMGRCTRDPEIRFSQGGTAICKVGFAVDSGYGDKKQPVFVDVAIFGKRGEAFDKHHEKGAAALLEGELRLDTWDDKNTGQKRSKLYVVADSWEFVGGKKEQRDPAPTAQAEDWDPFA